MILSQTEVVLLSFLLNMSRQFARTSRLLVFQVCSAIKMTDKIGKIYNKAKQSEKNKMETFTSASLLGYWLKLLYMMIIFDAPPEPATKITGFSFINYSLNIHIEFLPLTLYWPSNRQYQSCLIHQLSVLIPFHQTASVDVVVRLL